ncbi:YncE family protein [Methylobacterium sp. A54F]
MRLRTAWLAGLVTLWVGGAEAAEGPPFLLVGLDGKTFFEADGPRNGPNGRDALAIVDIADPARPRLAHTIPLDTSVYGPPTNLQITPDGRLGLVTSPVLMRQAGPGEPWYAQADDRLHVVDLAADPPRLLETIRVGRQPSGLAIDRSGRFALVANREDRSVTLLAIEGRTVRPVASVGVGDEAAAVAIAPDGARAFVAKNKAGTVGVLTIAGDSLAYDPAGDVPVGPGPYGLAVTPDGAFVLSGNVGASPSDGQPDAVALIRAAGPGPALLDQVGVGDTAEALAVSPDGRLAAVSVVKGAAAPHGSPAYTPGGAAVLLAILPEGRLRRLGEAPAGAVTQGIAFDPSGAYVYVGNYVDRTLGVYRVENGTLRETGFRLALPGQPASLRGRP